MLVLPGFYAAQTFLHFVELKRDKNRLTEFVIENINRSCFQKFNLTQHAFAKTQAFLIFFCFPTYRNNFVNLALSARNFVVIPCNVIFDYYLKTTTKKTTTVCLGKTLKTILDCCSISYGEKKTCNALTIDGWSVCKGQAIS